MEQFKTAIEDNNVEMFKQLLVHGTNPRIEDNYPIKTASKYGRTQMVRLLLADPRVDPSSQNNCAIRTASQKGHLEVVKLLLADPRVDPSAQNNSAIRVASQNGHLEVVRLLLADPQVDPSAGNNYAIRAASYGGHLEVVRLLLADPRVDPSADNNEAIRLAASYGGHLEVVRLLLADPRVDPSANGNYAIIKATENKHDDVVKLLKEHVRLYPNPIIRQHNLPLQNQIQKLEDKILEFQEQREFYIERFEEIREMYERGIPVNPKAEMIIDLHLDILKSEIGKLSDQIIRLKKEQEEFYISNL